MPRLRHLASSREGFVMLVTLIIMALITVMGATSLSVAGVDHRIASHNRRHMVVFNTSVAGTDHARAKLETENPPAENVDSAGDSHGDFVTQSQGDTKFGGTSFDQNLGVYWVEAVYERCSNPPPGYSTEQGRASFRSDYWSMYSTSRMTDSSFSDLNESQSITVATIRKVVRGPCKVR